MQVKQELTKLYYSIGEVAKMFDVSTSLIRYWETEFRQLKPKKNRKGDRQFTKKEIQVLERIFSLVKEEGYTLDGAKKAMKTSPQKDNPDSSILNKLKSLRDRVKKLQSSI